MVNKTWSRARQFAYYKGKCEKLEHENRDLSKKLQEHRITVTNLSQQVAHHRKRCEKIQKTSDNEVQKILFSLRGILNGR